MLPSARQTTEARLISTFIQTQDAASLVEFLRTGRLTATANLDPSSSNFIVWCVCFHDKYDMANKLLAEIRKQAPINERFLLYHGMIYAQDWNKPRMARFILRDLETNSAEPKAQYLATALFVACRNKQVRIVQRMLEDPMLNINFNLQGISVLDLAVEANDITLMQVLVQYLASHPEKIDEREVCDAFIKASQFGHTEIVSLMLAKLKFNISYRHPETGASALIMAAQEGRGAVVKEIFKFIKDQKVKSSKEISETLFFASKEGHRDIVKEWLSNFYLIDIEQTEDKISNYLEKSLLGACHGGYKLILNDLLDHLKKHQKFKNSKEIVIVYLYACEIGNSEAVTLLWQSGLIDVLTLKPNFAAAAFSKAQKHAHVSDGLRQYYTDLPSPDKEHALGHVFLGASINKDLRLASQFLHEFNVDVYFNGKDRQSALIWASINEDHAMLHMLISHIKSDPKYINAEQLNFIFLVACENGCLATLKILLDNGLVDLNFQDEQGADGLIFATYNNREEVVKELLSRPGISLHARTIFGANAFLIACYKGNLDIVNRFLNKDDLGAAAIIQAFQFVSMKGHWHLIKPLIAYFAVHDYRITNEDTDFLAEVIDNNESQDEGKEHAGELIDKLSADPEPVPVLTEVNSIRKEEPPRDSAPKPNWRRRCKDKTKTSARYQGLVEQIKALKKSEQTVVKPICWETNGKTLTFPSSKPQDYTIFKFGKDKTVCYGLVITPTEDFETCLQADADEIRQIRAGEKNSGIEYLTGQKDPDFRKIRFGGKQGRWRIPGCSLSKMDPEGNKNSPQLFIFGNVMHHDQVDAIQDTWPLQGQISKQFSLYLSNLTLSNTAFSPPSGLMPGVPLE